MIGYCTNLENNAIVNTLISGAALSEINEENA